MQTIIGRVLTVVAALDGVTKVMKVPQVVEATTQLGFPESRIVLIGVLALARTRGRCSRCSAKANGSGLRATPHSKSRRGVYVFLRKALSTAFLMSPKFFPSIFSSSSVISRKGTRSRLCANCTFSQYWPYFVPPGMWK